MGLISKNIIHEGLTINEDMQEFDYFDFKKMKHYKYYIDTTLVLKIDYIYKNIGNLLFENVEDFDCRDSSKVYQIQHSYLFNPNGVIKVDTAICHSCGEAKKITKYYDSNNIEFELKYDNHGNKIHDIRYIYDKKGNLIEKLNIGKRNKTKTKYEYIYKNGKLFQIRKKRSNNPRILVSEFVYTCK